MTVAGNPNISAAEAYLTVGQISKARDSRYDNERDQEMTARRWASLTAGEPGGADYRTVLKAVVDAGHREMVAAFDDDDAVEEDFLVYEMDEETCHG